MSYLRYPEIRGDEVVFVADDDLWLVAAGGGRAVRLTHDHAPVRSPRFSPDGSQIAFMSRRDGHAEAMLLDRASGDVRRLTWFGRPELLVAGWEDDTHVIVSVDAGEPFSRRWRLRSVSTGSDAAGVDAGATLAGTQMPLGIAMSVARHPDGAVAVTTPCSRDAAMWKRYRGGTASALWIGAGRTSGDVRDWTRVLPDEAAGIYSPCWVGDRLVFTSDLGARFPDRAGEQAQLWSVDAEGGDLRQHTRHTFDGDGPHGFVRDAASDGDRVVYHARGRLYLLDSLDADAREIPVELGLGAPADLPVTADDQLDDVRPDAGADASLVSWRGMSWWLTHRAGPARALGATPGVRVREPRVLNATEVVQVSDADGEDRLEVVPVDALAPTRVLETGPLGRVLHLAPAPEGDAVAVITHDGRILIVSTTTGSVTEAGRSPEHEAIDPTWSPDGRWLVWAQPTREEAHQLVGYDRRGSRTPVALTSGQFDDVSPAFTRDGKHLVLLSARTLDPSYSRFTFDLYFDHAVRPWLVPLRADQPAPFGASADGWPVSEMIDARREQGPAEGSSDAASEGAAADAEPKPDPSRIDVDGFEERMVPFPVPSGEYDSLQSGDDGVLWIKRVGAAGVLGATRAGVEGDKERDVLQRYSFSARKVTDLCDLDSYRVSGDGKRIVIRDKDDVVVLPSAQKVEPDDDARIKVDLGRLRHDIDRRAEWRQMFDDNGRLMRDQYWREDMNGVDWANVLEVYRPLVDELRTHDDLVDLLWETVAELNTSHAYVMPTGDAPGKARRLGALGADLRIEDGHVVIERILSGESSNPDARSPLRAAGVAAVDGDRITAVNGQPVSSWATLGRALQGTAGKVTELTLQQPRSPRRRVAVVPIADEEPLRYQAWVNSRRDYTEQHSAGRFGYLHVPDMMGRGWAQFHRDLERAVQHQGLVVDVRYNRGGHTSQLVIERLARKILGWDVARHGASPVSYPAQAPRGPLVFVCNQFSGSDGDIVNAAAQELGLGPVLGERTWGGVVGIDGRFALVDGTEVTQPRYAFSFNRLGWGVENHGVDPDIVVALSPADWEADADVQLDRAIEELDRLLADAPAVQPPELPGPRVS